MNLILGLDPSIKKAGYCVLDTDAPYDSFVERGRLRTSGSDGILVQRLLKQQEQIRGIIDKYDIKFVSMEAPYLDGGESEHLFALNQFIHEVYLEKGSYVICFPPQQMKKLACPGQKANEVHKPQMIAEAKKRYRLAGKILTDDEADAMHAAHLGKLFYNWHFTRKLSDKDLHPDMLHAFSGKHTFTKGLKKGATEYTGLIYRENELFYDFKRIAERKEHYGSAEEKAWENRGGREGRPSQESIGSE